MSILDTARRVTDVARDLINGEPARAIGYGAAAVIYLVAKASGRIPDVTPEQALTQAGAAIVIVASVVETIRHYVYAPNTVFDLVAGVDR